MIGLLVSDSSATRLFDLRLSNLSWVFVPIALSALSAHLRLIENPPRVAAENQRVIQFDLRKLGPVLSSVEDKGKGPAIQQSDNKFLAPLARAPGARTSFRLTPQRPVTSPISEVDTSASASFLDLSGSNSNSNSDSSHREPSLGSQGQQGLQSRWSATTGTDISHNVRQEQSSGSGSGSGSGASASYPFPFPVSLPHSPHHPEGFKPSPPISPSWATGSLAAPPGRLDVNPHPFGLVPNPTSPSDSVPMSISDLHFRHSDSENDELGSPPMAGTSSHLPPHPPLPASVPPTPTFPPPISTSGIASPSLTEGLSTPSYIVSRVFTHNKSDSALASETQSPSTRAFGRDASP
ncbi:hypothetical protein BT96DRAFT_671734 [Gymnopus androsaceus JB14]|uniref:Uncharacterized protein n=1 Tax=Gymnopus androsaceus JB14 TaxID=1447944 RepID=A0A6A4IDZ9_9AGAR|nr:hypothetical protein BT96DRAFT_671734 [Gymnopus androsaceus JB14]